MQDILCIVFVVLCALGSVMCRSVLAGRASTQPLTWGDQEQGELSLQVGESWEHKKMSSEQREGQKLQEDQEQ